MRLCSDGGEEVQVDRRQAHVVDDVKFINPQALQLQTDEFRYQGAKKND
jgi:hypothetical protein